MKTIGFIDYYLSEWHANNYPAWIRKASEQLSEEFVVKYAWAELDVSPVDGVSTELWCEKHGVTRCGSIDELCKSADYILILAPSDPDKHLGYAEAAFKCGKRTYIDKTFAPDHRTAKRIFDAAERFGTQFFSSSALRYATELADIGSAKSVITTGGGRSLEEYIIHQIEMVVKLIKGKPVRLRVDDAGETQRICSIDFEGGKKAKMLYAPSYGFTVNVDTEDGGNVYKTISGDFFSGLIADILSFYLTGKPSFDAAETLDVMKIRGKAVQALSTPGQWLEID